MPVSERGPLFDSDFWNPSWVFWIQTAAVMMARPTALRRKPHILPRRRFVADIFFSHRRYEAIAPSDHGLQVLRPQPHRPIWRAGFSYGGVDSLLDIDEHILAP